MPLPLKRVLKGLRKLDAQKEEGRKHTKYVVWIDGQKAAMVTIPRSWKDTISDKGIKGIADQLLVRPRQFHDIVECTKHQEDYIAMWSGSPFRRRS